ncbi:MAG: hypothetical protein R3F61_20180 [Myxococcota bacterium]
MLRLTLRAREDARFLARIIERDGFAFVLDYGDSSMVADASERIARGFSLWRGGKLESVSPASPELLPLLAEFYAQEGLLVSLEEPSFADRPEPLDARLPHKPASQHSITDFREETELVEPEEETELVSFADLPDLGDLLEEMEPPRKTNPGAVAKRALWAPPGTPPPQKRQSPPRPKKPQVTVEPPPPAVGSGSPAPPAVPDPSAVDDRIITLPPQPPPRLQPEPDLEADLEPVDDEEETELVSPEMRARAMAMEEGHTELHSDAHDLSATLSELAGLGEGEPEPEKEEP